MVETGWLLVQRPHEVGRTHWRELLGSRGTLLVLLHLCCPECWSKAFIRPTNSPEASTTMVLSPKGMFEILTKIYQDPIFWRFWFNSLKVMSKHQGFSGGSVVKNPPADSEDIGSIPGLGRSTGEGSGYPLQVLPGESHGQKSLVGYHP